MIVRTLLALLRTLTFIAILASLLLHNYARISCHWHWRRPESFLRMVVIADPQMEGDAKIARLGKRAIVDLAFNDAYMRHIFTAMTKPSWGHPRDWLENPKEAAKSSLRAYPTHVSILGDLFSSQWIDNIEFETRLRRYTSIFPGSDLKGHPVLINITGNHDIGYGYDISQERMDRWEGAFGQSNFVQVVSIPGSHQRLHLVALNTMLLDGPSADENLRGQTWEFLQETAKIKEQFPGDKVVLLTHIPFHKESGTCVDPPSIHIHSDNTIVEQTMLTPNSTQWILNHLQPDFVLNGHDHFGCDVVHTPSWNAEQEKYIWSAKTTGSGTPSSESPEESTHLKPVREVTQRSMMAEFGGYSGLFEVKSKGQPKGENLAVNDVEFYYTSCGFFTDLYVWIVVAIDIIVAVCWSIYLLASVALRLATPKTQRPNRFLRITGSKNQLLRRLELLRVSKAERQSEGHVLVQGIKTIQELAAKGHPIRTLGITYDDNNLPIQSPALDIIQGSTASEGGSDQSSSRIPTKSGSFAGRAVFKADQYVAASRKLTTRILGTDSKIAEHEVWAEVAIPDYGFLFSPSGSNHDDLKTESPTSSRIKKSHRPSWMAGKASEIERMLVLDRISDPGNMGLLIRAGMALNWHGSWHTPGTVDEYNNKVVRASRALCLDWPTKTGGWKELGEFLEGNGMTLLVADMIPRWIQDQLQSSTSTSSAPSTMSTKPSPSRKLNTNSLVWWNWPDSLPRTKLPSKVALLMGSEHHGVNISASVESGAANQGDQRAKDLLFEKAIRVSIPMNAAVESMNVATAATAMMWELNRLLSLDTADSALSDAPQIFDRVVKK